MFYITPAWRNPKPEITQIITHNLCFEEHNITGNTAMTYHKFRHQMLYALNTVSAVRKKHIRYIVHFPSQGT